MRMPSPAFRGGKDRAGPLYEDGMIRRPGLRKPSYFT